MSAAEAGAGSSGGADDADDADVQYVPPEIVEQILLMLDGRTFVRSRRVCKAWRQIVDRLSLETDIWKSFCLTEFPDAWASVYEKGDLPWSDVYANICLWEKVKSAKVMRAVFQNYSNSADKHIVTLNIAKGGSINVTLRNSIKKYDIKTFNPTEEITGQYYCYYENEFVKLIHTENHTLFLRPSVVYNPDTPIESVSIDSVYLFRVSGDICYYVTLRQELGMYNLKDHGYAARSILVKWYNSDSITALDCHRDKIYLLTNSGKILIYECNRLKKLRSVRWPYNSNLYRKFYLFKGNIFFYCDYSNFRISIPDGKEVNYTGLYASSILFHGNILVIGTYFGLLSLYLINDIEDLLVLDELSPIASHLLCVEFPISGIDVFEERGCHCVFAWTQSNIYMIKYSHFPNNCNEKVLCNSFQYCSLVKCPDSNTCDLNSNSDDTT